MAIITTFAEPPDSKVYSIAIIIPTFSLLLMILVFPALIQHYRNRNIGATALVAGVIVALFNDFINAVIWRNDDMENWYDGVGLCDIEVKVMVFQNVLFPAAVCCILRALAAVMNTNSQSWIQTTAQKRRGYAIDILCCVGAPSLQMLFHYIVQPNRYYVYGVAGCTPSTDLTWLALVLIYLPPIMWTIVDVFYAILIMIRLIRYRLTFNTILANSNTTKSRFLRLYILCCITTFGMLPMECITLYLNIVQGIYPYSWSVTHPTDGSWNATIFVRSNGGVFYDRVVWMCGGALVFFLFGFGRDAMKMYKEAMVTIGLGRCFPTLRPEFTRRSSVAATISTIGSKARLWLKRKDTNATWTNSTVSMTDSMSTPSPKKMTFMESLRSPTLQQQKKSTSPFGGFTSIFKKKRPSRNYHDDDPFILRNVTGPSHFQSTVTAEPVSKQMHSKKASSGEVLVMKEVRQASETAETLPAKMFEGV